MTSSPSANGDGVFDLEAAAASEATAAPFAFTYKGGAYELPPMGGWPLTTVRAVALGDLEGALAELIGPKTYDELCDAGLTIGELTALFRASGAVQAGLSLPNSRRPVQRASTRTSKRRLCWPTGSTPSTRPSRPAGWRCCSTGSRRRPATPALCGAPRPSCWPT